MKLDFNPTTYLAGLGSRLYSINYPLYKKVYFFYKKMTDKEILSFLKSYVKKGMVVLDVGANIGFYSVYLARLVGINGRVHSFEPCRDTFKRLVQSTSMYPQVVLNQTGIMDSAGEAFLNFSAAGNVDNWLEKKDSLANSKSTISTITLDQYCQKMKLEVDLVKMDIQGAELMALQGFSESLKLMDNIVILMELWPYGLRRSGASIKELFAFLEENNLKMSSLSGQKLKSFDLYNYNPDNYINVLTMKGRYCT
ncbi:FkbM family methyltransferase [Desulfonatronovibrio magnus]|uniref:FkbM family methyltransferase n=1 Tax=Desulfonatronovibrio magnus TaxID=698827 RepID=UPI0005EB0629|nr:FkbM family methyltransferase [Desulfonatronovibrio magnus]